MDTPLFDALDKNKKHVSFHTPAHSGVVSLYDVTELSFSDNLKHPTGAIMLSQQEVSKAYGVDYTFFVTSGYTTAINIVISAFGNKTIGILGGQNQDTFDAVRRFAKGYYFASAKELTEYLDNNSMDIVIVQTPDNLGNVKNLTEIREAIRDKNTILVVDASCGSHFEFSDKFPTSATAYADIVIHLASYSLPVVSGGAFIHTKKAYYDRLRYTFNSIHPLPSYPTLLSLESGVKEISEKGQSLYSDVIEEIDYFIGRLNLDTDFKAEKTDDRTKLIIKSIYEGDEVARRLADYGIYPEMYFDNKVVFIITPYNYKNLFRLHDALEEITKLHKFIFDRNRVTKSKKLVKVDGEIKITKIDDCLGKILATDIGYYPTGEPILFVGDTLLQEDINFIKKYSKRLFGLENDSLFVL